MLPKESEVLISKVNKTDAVSLAQRYKSDVLAKDVVDAFDISINSANTKYQPKEYGQKVKVKLSNLDMNLEIDDSKQYALMHIIDDENYEILPIDKITNEEIEFTTGSFSTYIIITVGSNTITFDGDNFKVLDATGNEITDGAIVASGTAFHFSIVPNDKYGVSSVTATLADGTDAISGIGGGVVGKTCTISSVSENLTVYVTTELAPNITTHPVTQKVVVGNTAKYTVVAENATTYEWQYRESKNDYWKSAGSTSSTLNVSTTTYLAGYAYRCLVGNASFTDNERVVSDIAYLSLTSYSSISFGEIPRIIEQPTSIAKFKNGVKPTFSVTALGTNLTFTWQYRESEDDYWKNTTSTQGSASTSTPSTSTTDAPLKKSTFTGVALTYLVSGYQYRCLVGNDYYKEHDAVKTETVYISTAEDDITIQASILNLQFTKQPEVQKVYLGETAIYEVAATSATTYKWQYKSGDGYWEDVTSAIGTGYNSAKLQVSTSSMTEESNLSGLQFRCLISNSAVPDYKKTSDIAVLSIAQGVEEISVYAEVDVYLMGRENVDYMLGAYRADNATTYRAAYVTKVIFASEEPEGATDSWDVSYNLGDMAVISYIVPSTKIGTIQCYDQYIVSSAPGIIAKECYQLFSGYVNMTAIESISSITTEGVANMQYMFYNCKNLLNLDVSGFNTDTVTNMGSMFNGCNKLSSLTLGSMNTSNVKNMSYMFSACNALTSLNVSSFDTSKVTDMCYMFDSCKGLTSLSVSNFNTGNVTDMSNMFYMCSGLTSLDLSKFITTKVTNMSSMFDSCTNLVTLDISKFDTSNVKSIYSMFSNCSALTSLDVSKFDTSKVTSMFSMFYGCSSLTSLDVSKFNTSKVKNMSNMFAGCERLTDIDVSNFDTTQVTSIDSMFSSCKGLTTLVLGEKFNNINGTSMFSSCDNLSRVISLKDAFLDSNIMSVSSENDLGDLVTRVLYVPNASGEALYEADATYMSLLGVDRIEPLMELAGDNPATAALNKEYKDDGVTVANWSESSSGEYISLGLSVVTEGLPLDTTA